jgi:hypothetical protein
LLDSEGYPLPIRALEMKPHAEGFSLALPKGVPWSRGKATLSFEGREMFVGEAVVDGGHGVLKVERALPVLPLTADTSEVVQPTPDTQAKLMKRLEHETKRRNQPIPTIPAQPPQPSALAKLRGEMLAKLYGG